jgi:peptide/nickel transport system substrate-binding protein
VQGVAAVPPANAAAVTGDAKLRLVRTESRGAVYSVYLNTGRAPFTDEKVRQAFRAAVDVDGLVKGLYFGQYSRAWGILSPTTPLYEPAVENSWKQDEAAANQLLDGAGWTARDADGYRVKDGKRLAVHWPTTQQMESAQQRGALAQGIQAAAKKVGIEVVRDRIQTAQLFEQVAKGDYDLFDMSWARADPDILRGFLGSTSTFPIGQNVARISDPQVDSWVNGASATLDEAARRQAYGQAQKWAVDHAVALPVFVPAYLLGVSAKVHGLAADPAAFPLFYNAWLGA